jgi:hypothetical protein
VRGGSEVLSLEDRPGLTRELPAWMCDAATCLAMTLGPPLVPVDALNELAATLAALAHDLSARPSSTSSLVKEALDAATDGALANTTHAAPGTRGDHAAACEGSKALLQALADLLLAALAQDRTDPEKREGGDEPEDHA